MVVKRLGSEKYICETYGVTDAKAWAKEQVALMNLAEKEEVSPVTMDFFPSRDIPANQKRCFNGGYLFLQCIYYQLGLHKISKAISTRHGFEFNLNYIFSRLIYTRILYPGSKLSAYEDSHRFLEQPDFGQHISLRRLIGFRTPSVPT